MGPGSGYILSPERWDRLKKKYGALNPEAYGSTIDEIQNPELGRNFKAVDPVIKKIGTAQNSKRPDEIVIAISPAFGLHQKYNITGIPHGNILKELMAGIEEEGLK